MATHFTPELDEFILRKMCSIDTQISAEVLVSDVKAASAAKTDKVDEAHPQEAAGRQKHRRVLRVCGCAVYLLRERMSEVRDMLFADPVFQVCVGVEKGREFLDEETLAADLVEVRKFGSDLRLKYVKSDLSKACTVSHMPLLCGMVTLL